MHDDPLLRHLEFSARGPFVGSRERQGDDVGLVQLCDVCAEVSGTSAAGIMVMGNDAPLWSLATSNALSAGLDDLQFLLGEGPAVDAHRGDRPALAPNLAVPGTAGWLAFAAHAVDGGVQAAFSFPLRVHSLRIGVLNLYRPQPGPLSADQYADTLASGQVAADAILEMYRLAPPRALAEQSAARVHAQSVFHQAVGMVSVQLSASVTEASLRLRAYTFASDRSLLDVAEAVVTRSLRFEQ